ncbi:MAG TPA: gamma-glutamyltransferase family protein [Acholeplasmataceae bacterium]|nr:gamma-glutamyltransferase family protein [Acholeplasmataceae bacterium]
MINFNPHYNPYPATRNLLYAKNGVVATSQPLAAQAGLDILKQGGNAVDAAIATAACLTVVEPTANGIGGDAFAIVYINGQLHGLNASGTCPASLSIDTLKEKGITEIPKYGFIPVLVPGAPAAWIELSKRFGKLPLSDVLKPAINYARYGFPVSPGIAKSWNRAFEIFKKELISEEFSSWFRTFTKNSKTPEAGEVFFLKDHANTLEKIETFYTGELADRIDEYSRKYNGYIRKSDLENYKPLWVDPISVNYKGYDIWEIPPNGQGFITLQALKILEGFKFNSMDNAEELHLQIEALKLAFADGINYIADPNYMKLNVNDLLDNKYISSRRKLIKDTASIFTHGKPKGSETVYLATADSEGNMVSFIQSNYMGFGSGLVVPETGIALQNRGHNFSLDPTKPNALGPNKRSYHTIIPGFLTKGNKPIGPFGVMGGFMQPQAHLQVILNTIDYQLNPQATLDKPRWQWLEKDKIIVEPNFDLKLIEALKLKGHKIEIDNNIAKFGRGQIIWQNPETKVYVAGTDSRTDSQIAIY